MADENEVRLPYMYVADPVRGRPIAGAKIFVGMPDRDPAIPSNQLAISAVQEDGSIVAVSQPVRTSAGGIPILNGSPIQLVVSGEHSIKILDSSNAQVYYYPSQVDGMRPTTIINTVTVPLTTGLPDRFVNNTLFATNISFISYYNLYKPALNLGLIGNSPFIIENIPANRFDLAQGSSTVDLGVLP